MDKLDDTRHCPMCEDAAKKILELEQRVKVLTDEFDRVTNMPIKWYVSEREARFVFATLEARDEFAEYMIGSKVLKGTPLPKESKE